MSEFEQNIQWFPGHMAKTLRDIEAQLKAVDMVIELIDARLPASSRNPVLAGLIGSKPMLMVLNKSDLADPESNKKWIEYFKGQGLGAIELCAKSRQSGKTVSQQVANILAEKTERREQRGMTGQKSRIMVVGIPNIGKSTLINTLTGNSAVKVENRPGVTRGRQWVSAPDFDLLDMPGTLWPKLDNKRSAYFLAFTAAIKDDILDVSDLACELIDALRNRYADRIKERYGIEYNDEPSYIILENIARKRGMILKGGETDYERVSKMLLTELRKGELGKISFEEPDDLF